MGRERNFRCRAEVAFAGLLTSAFGMLDDDQTMTSVHMFLKYIQKVIKVGTEEVENQNLIEFEEAFDSRIKVTS